MNKKSFFNATSELIKWIPNIIVVALVVSTMVIIVFNYTKQNFDIEQLQQGILRQRFVYSENCLAYEDDMIQPGIIDKKKFNKNNLNDCFQINERIGVNLNLIANEIKTVNLNDNMVNKFNFCFDKKHFACSNYTYYVLIREDNNIERGLLNIAMIKLK